MNTNLTKRILSLALSFVLVIGSIPTLAFAAEEDGLCAHHTVHIDCGYGVDGDICDYSCEICNFEQDETSNVERVQSMIDGLPEDMTEDSKEELLAHKDTLDAAIGALSQEEIVMLDLSKYNAVYNAPMTTATPSWEYYTNPNGDGGYYAIITAYNGPGGSVTIPNTLGGAKVEGVSTYTFYYSNAAITSLTCGSNLKWFSGADGLEDSLRSVNFSAATMEEIDSTAFWNCDKLTSFAWPKGVKKIGNGAFYNTGLTSVTIPSTVTQMGGDTIGVTAGAFENCDKLTSVTINATGLTQISYSTFENCIALKSVKLSSGITSIGNDAFSGCAALTTINWGNSKVAGIGDYAFYDCAALTDITLPSTLTRLGECCFAGTGITSLTLPDSLTNFTGSAFQYATKLRELAVNSTNTRYKTENGILFNKAGTKLICYPAGKTSVSKYQIPDGVTTIGKDAFGVSFNSRNIYCGIGNISNLYFPDTVKTVEESGAAYYSGNFYFCGNKPSVTKSYDLGDSSRVNYYYTPGRTGWTESNKVKAWPNESHCTVKSTTDVAPTCTIAGGKEISCPICGYKTSDLSGSAALGHDWADWEIVAEPTCTAHGQRQRICQRNGCAEIETESIEKLGHKWTSLFCQDDAICTRCDLTRAAREHNWVEVSCTEPKYCTLCPLTEGEALGHLEVVDEAKAPTCTVSGKTEGLHCSRCNKVLTAQTSVPATGHTTVIDPAVPATQHYTGLTEGSHCGTCNTVLVAQKVTAATGSHTKHAVCAERCSHEDSHEIVAFNKWTYGSFSSGNYYMGADITLSQNITITGNAYLCLNGHTLTFTDYYRLTVNYGASLTICDCAGNGQIIRGTAQSGGSGIIVNRGTMTIYGGTYCPDGEGWWIDNTGSLNIFDGTFGIAIHNNYDNGSSSTTRYGNVVIYNATIQYSKYSDIQALYNGKGCKMTIYGGDFSATGNVLENIGTADICGGKFYSLSNSTSIIPAVINNQGTMSIRNAVVTAKGGRTIENDIYWGSTSSSSSANSTLRIYEGSTITNNSEYQAAVYNRCNLYVYGGSVSGYIGIENGSAHSGTDKDGGRCYVSGGNISGIKCAILNGGNASGHYENGVPVWTDFSRGIVEISNSPNLGKIILKFPESLVINYNCSVIVDLELDMTHIVQGDTISDGNVNKLPTLNLLNEGYVLLYNYSKGIYLETNHCGATTSDDLRWKLTPDGKLTIFGTGRMYNYSFSSEQPWNKSKTQVEIKEVILEPGITHIGSSAFAYLNGLTKMVIPEGVTTIGTWVFEGSNNLEEVHLPSSLSSIGRCFFATISGTKPPAAVYYNGCVHQWENVKVDTTQPAPVEPICHSNENIEDGDCTTALTCSVCDIIITPAKEKHTGGIATCAAKAECSVCGMAYGDLGHVATPVPAVEPDCVNTGLTEGSICDLCGAVLIRQTVIPANGHAYETVTIPPTCAEAGVTIHTCHCGDSYTDNQIDALGHYVLRPDKELVDAHTLHNDTIYPFTLSNGWYESSNKAHSSTSTFQIRAVYDCTLALKYKVSSEPTYDKLHILVNSITKKTISGEVSETLYTVDLKAGDIVSIRYSKDISVSRGSDTGYFMIASCTQAELDTIVQIPAEEAEPTCTEGVVCERCKQTVKAALGHDEVTDAKVVPTCTQNGLSEGSHCQRCDEILIPQEVISVAGHSWKDATCTEAKCCTVCGSTEGDPNGHEYNAVVTPPTCEAKGYTTHNCPCGDSYVDSYVNATGHAEVVDEKVESDCINTGLTEGKHCSVCEEILVPQKEVSAKGHSMKKISAVEPTVNTEGNISHFFCSVCIKLFADEAGEKELNPEDVVLEKLPATAEINGVRYETLAEALEAAQPGDTVQLQQDTYESNVILRKGVAMDLNGHTLETDYIFAVNGANIVDNSEDNTGLLKADANCVLISKDNAQLPVWNGEGYVFTTVDYRKALIGYDADSLKFAFLPLFKSGATDLLKDGVEGNKVTVEVRVSWTTTMGQEYRNLVFNEEQVALAISSGGAFVLTFSGFSKLDMASGITVEGVVISETGVSIASEAIVVDVTEG